MSDSRDCTAAGPRADTPSTPTTWEDRPGFREVFLIHFPPLAAQALREAGRHLYDAVLEQELQEPAEPWVRARVRALAGDLRFTAEVFATLADARSATLLSHEEHYLATKCQVWAAEVVAVCLGVEGALEGRS